MGFNYYGDLLAAAERMDDQTFYNSKPSIKLKIKKL